MSNDFLDISEFLLERKPALQSALHQQTPSNRSRWTFPHFLHRKTASPFRFTNRKRLTRRKTKIDRIHAFYAKRYSMKDLSSILPGVSGKLPWRHTAKCLRHVRKALRHGVVFHDVTPYLQASKDLHGLRWASQLAGFLRGLAPDTFISVRIVEVQSRDPLMIELIKARMPPGMQSSVTFHGRPWCRAFFSLNLADALPVFRGVNSLGIPSTLLGFQERRWVSLQTQEAFDPRDMRSAYFCIAVGKGVPRESAPFHSVDSMEGGSAGGPQGRKLGIVTYGGYHDGHRRGAAFLHVTRKHAGQLTVVGIDGERFRCYPLDGSGEAQTP